MTGAGTRGRAARPRPGPPPDPAPHWAYFLDLDGTLIDLATSPDVIHTDPALHDLIERLNRAAHSAVALISGRAIADLDRLFPQARLPVAGQHGTERRDAAGRVSRHDFPVEQLAAARARITTEAARRSGLWLEDKGLSLALHYRRAPQLAALAHRVMAECQAALGAAFCIQAGKRVVELKPAGRDKGVAVREFMDEAPFRGRTPVFLGDDATDEFGFAMVNRLGGHSLKVGPGPTAARWRLRDVRAVRAWLARAVAAEERP